MERLTNTAWRNLDPWECCGQDNFCTRGCHEKGGCNNGCIVPKLYGRLAAYEDTGLEPEDLKKAFNENAILKLAEQALNTTPYHIRDIIKADQNGQLVVLPCKVGDHVWVNGREAIVVWFFGYKTERYLHTQFLDNAQYIDIPFSEIGKTVFLTREEAEAALAGGGGDNG